MAGEIIPAAVSASQGIHDRDGGTCNICGAVMGNAAVHEAWHLRLTGLLTP